MPTQALGQIYRAMQPYQMQLESTIGKQSYLNSASFASKLLGPAKQATEGTRVYTIF